jgi:tetratricopeptide (TPR) repeat protein
MNDDRDLLEHVLAGRHVAVVGAGRLPGLRSPSLLRVSCAGAVSALSPLLEARRCIERALGEGLFDQARGRVMGALRRRLLGEVDEPEAEGLVELANRLAARSPGRAALVLEDVDGADEGTLVVLRRLLGPEGGLELPVIVALSRVEADGPSGLLVDAVANGGGVVVSRGGEAKAPADAATQVPEAPAPRTAEPSVSLDSGLAKVPADVLVVLRAAAVLGPAFDGAELAALLGLDVIDLVDRLQTAAACGVELLDDGDLGFRFADGTLRALRADLLPSFTRAVRLRHADLVGRAELPPHPAAPEASAPPAPPAPSAPPAPPAPPAPAPVAAAPAVQPSSPLLSWPAAASAPTVIPTGASSAPAPRLPVTEPKRSPSRKDTDVRRAIDRSLAEARKAESSGAYGDAMRVLERTLEHLDGASPELRSERARVLGELGRVLYRGTGREQDFSLTGAFDALAEALAALAPGESPKLHARLASLAANIAYDLGEPAALDGALAALTAASRAAEAAGDAYGAARLFNDQAALYVRMGDPVRAAHLLEQSRKVFDEKADTDPVALAEMAETAHLYARIPLHVRLRPGREQDALAAAMAQAKTAEGAFRRLSASRELARVWETMGRLALLQQEPALAIEHLKQAARAQEVSADVVGLARTAAALSDALAALGRAEEAVLLLTDSVRLNLAKGSPIGLAFNRRALEALATAAPANETMRTSLQTLADMVQRAEAVLGRLVLPGETGL